MPDILNRAIEYAMDGDKTMMKLLIEMCMSRANVDTDTSTTNDKVKVTIRNLTIDKLDKPLKSPLVETDEKTETSILN